MIPISRISKYLSKIDYIFLVNDKKNINIKQVHSLYRQRLRFKYYITDNNLIDTIVTAHHYSDVTKTNNIIISGELKDSVLFNSTLIDNYLIKNKNEDVPLLKKSSIIKDSIELIQHNTIITEPSGNFIHTNDLIKQLQDNNNNSIIYKSPFLNKNNFRNIKLCSTIPVKFII